MLSNAKHRLTRKIHPTVSHLTPARMMAAILGAGALALSACAQHEVAANHGTSRPLNRAGVSSTLKPGENLPNLAGEELLDPQWLEQKSNCLVNHL